MKNSYPENRAQDRMQVKFAPLLPIPVRRKLTQFFNCECCTGSRPNCYCWWEPLLQECVLFYQVILDWKYLGIFENVSVVGCLFSTSRRPTGQ